MSAFLCSDRHLSALVNAAASLTGYRRLAIHRYLPVTATPEALALSGQDEREALFNALFEENLASIAFRYPDAPEVLRWRQTDAPRFSARDRVVCPVAVLKLIDCYEYQSCEHPTWATSNAALFCVHLRKALIAGLPGYEEADWSL